jgi:hypothetical protein
MTISQEQLDEWKSMRGPNFSDYTFRETVVALLVEILETLRANQSSDE